jgi:hypothetical protein
MARITKAFVNNATTRFRTTIDRGGDLYRKIVVHGYSRPPAGGPAVRLNNPDTRDAAQFIFFEVAAQFEDYAKRMFQAEVRSMLAVTVAQSSYVMGDIDRGVEGKMGWGSPKMLKERGRNLLGDESFFGGLDVTLGGAYNDLVVAHLVRNRIAHSGGTAQSAFVKHLKGLGIAPAQRMGMGVGRFLRDYPDGTGPLHRNFFAYLNAYTAFADAAQAALP